MPNVMNEGLRAVAEYEMTVTYGAEIEALPLADQQEAARDLLPGLKAILDIDKLRTRNDIIHEWINKKKLNPTIP